MSHFIRHFVMLSGLSLFILNLQAGEPNRPPRLALVIGNAAYAEKPLKNPVNDAEGMAEVLRGLGFKVILKTNVDLNTMIDALRAYGNQLSDGGVGLFYFSGHGIQYNNLNYLIPIDANNLEDDELVIKRDTLGVDDILSRMESNNKRGVNILILDACRNNPFGGRDFKSVLGKGLAEMRAPIGSLIAYATAPNTIAKDNPKGLNGMYTKHLLAVLREMPQESILDLFTEVTRRVVIETSESQVPWKADSLRGKFCLAARGCGRLAIQPSVDVTESTSPQPIPKSIANIPVLPPVDNTMGVIQSVRNVQIVGTTRKDALEDALEITVRLDNGYSVSVVQETDVPFQRGERVHVLTSPTATRVSRSQVPSIPESTANTPVLPLTIDKGQSRDIMDYDQQQANQALEYKPDGQTVAWKNPYTNSEYEVTPTKTYETSQGPCRNYETVATIGGQRSVLYNKACRQPDGSWKPVGWNEH